jgi:hypothetical protein
MTKHNKYYYDKGRNGWTPDTTWQDEVIEDKDNKWSGGEINPKMLLTKEELKIDYSKEKTPNYYIGRVYGYEARKVVEDFDLSYNIGTATTYLLRAKRKHDTSVDCIQKAINHLEFELDKIKNEKTNL